MTSSLLFVASALVGIAVLMVILRVWRARRAGRSSQTASLSLQSTGFSSRLRDLFGRGGNREALLLELEGVLLESDAGPRLTQELLDFLRALPKESDHAEGLKQALKDRLKTYVRAHEPKLEKDHLHAWLILGVNGVGKTTTLAKLMARFKQSGTRVIAIAGDTFRAAAIEQLQVWGKRLGVDVIAQSFGADPGAVIFDGLQAARARKMEVALIDTAGRLHTKTPLIDELRKIERVITKFDATLPRQTFLVLDSTIGQNGLAQARAFSEAVKIDAAILTKWDGSAKGGVLFAIGKELGLPIAFVGIGEKAEDLRPFDVDVFIEGLF